MAYELPENIHPETISFCIEVPNERFYRQAFWGALWTLTRAYNHADDDDHTALEVAQVWHDLWWLNRNNFEDGECMPDECCDTTNDLLSQILKTMQNGFKIVPLEGNTLPPDFAGGDCAPSFFDHDDDETDSEVLLQRKKALCITAERYVKGILIAGLVDMSAPSALIDFVESQLPLDLPPDFAKLQVVYPSIFSGLAAFFAALTGGAELPLIACQMVDALQGENNTFVNFRSSVDAALLTSLLVPLAGLVQSSNGLAKNYQIFNLALHDANEEDLSDYSCPCGIEQGCNEDLELIPNPSDINANMTVITEAFDHGDNVYHIVQNTYQSTDPAIQNRYVASVTDAQGRCLDFDIVFQETQTPIAASYRLGCEGIGEGCDSETVFGGSTVGFAPCTGREIAWQSVEPIDTYLRIICCVAD